MGCSSDRRCPRCVKLVKTRTVQKFAGPNRVGSFSNDDRDGNENVIKAVALHTKKTTLLVHHSFLYIPLPLLHDYDVKMPNFSSYGGRKQATTNFLSLSKLECGPQEINSRELHLTFSATWNKQDLV